MSPPLNLTLPKTILYYQIEKIIECFGKPGSAITKQTPKDQLRTLNKLRTNDSPEQGLSKKIPQLDVQNPEVGNGDQLLMELLVNLFAYENRFSARQALQHSYFGWWMVQIKKS